MNLTNNILYALCTKAEGQDGLRRNGGACHDENTRPFRDPLFQGDRGRGPGLDRLARLAGLDDPHGLWYHLAGGADAGKGRGFTVSKRSEGREDVENRTLQLTAVIEPDGKYFTALCLELDVASCGKTPEEAFAALRDAVNVYLSYAVETGQAELLNRPVPEPLLSQYRDMIRQSRRPNAKAESRRFQVKLPTVPPFACVHA